MRREEAVLRTMVENKMYLISLMGASMYEYELSRVTDELDELKKSHTDLPSNFQDYGETPGI